MTGIRREHGGWGEVGWGLAESRVGGWVYLSGVERDAAEWGTTDKRMLKLGVGIILIVREEKVEGFA